jgi:hypothetical protein
VAAKNTVIIYSLQQKFKFFCLVTRYNNYPDRFSSSWSHRSLSIVNRLKVKDREGLRRFYFCVQKYLSVLAACRAL